MSEGNQRSGQNFNFHLGILLYHNLLEQTEENHDKLQDNL
jgi:hypothetical protein